MNRNILWIGMVGIMAVNAAQAQTRRPYVAATGRGTVSVPPDQVKISANVTTQAPTAQDATSQNAARMSNLLAALRKLLGSTAQIETTNLNVSPVYRSSQAGQPPAIVAYSASNSVEIALSVASAVGAVIDTASQNGATSVGGLRFGLKNPDPSVQQALRIAAQQARAHAEAMALAMGRTLGAVLSIQESGAGPIPILGRSLDATAGVATPVEPGTLEVSASVVLEAELN